MICKNLNKSLRSGKSFSMTFAGTPAQKIGTIDKILESSVISQIDNDGNHQYLHIQEECKNQLPLTIETKQLMVPLTNPNVDVVQFDKSFITMKVRIGFNVHCTMHDIPSDISSDIAEALVKMHDGAKVFIGFKNSTDCVGSRAVYHNGKLLTGTLQDHGSQESFIYHSYRNQEDLIKHKGVYTLAEAADAYDETSVCGVFVSLRDIFKSVGTHQDGTMELTFDLSIPFNDNLIFEDFVEYPNALFGDLEYYFRFNKDALVYRMCDPWKSIRKEYSNYNNGAQNWVQPMNDALKGMAFNERYSREYAQIGDELMIISNFEYNPNLKLYGMSTSKLWMTPTSISVDSCFSTIVGYKMRPDVLDQQRIKYQSQPWVRFSQNVTTMPFSQGATTSGLSITQQTYLNNVTDFVLTFPQTDREITVSKNPMFDELTLGTMGRKYPEQPLDTTSNRFAEIMLNASDVFYGQPRKEYIDSISIPRPAASENRMPYTDLTSFLLTLKVERPSALGLIFDGLDSEGKSVSVRVDAKHKYPIKAASSSSTPTALPLSADGSGGTGSEEEPTGPVASLTDENADPIPTNTLNTIPPILYLCNDSFFIFNSRDGGQCVYSDRDFNAVCAGFMSGAYVA